MSMFENNRYRWRETYFVLFEARNRPQLKTVEEALAELNQHYELTNAGADDSGRFESLTLLSPDDFSALDVCYMGGVEVMEHSLELVEELRAAACEEGEEVPVDQILRADGRFDVFHFERIPDDALDNDEPDEMLDPSALLLVLGTLARITDGIAIDPQTGTILSEDD